MIKKILSKISSGFRKNESGDLKSKFTEIHDKNLFHGVESVSGTGSDLFQTRIISVEIPKLLKKYDAKTFIDAPCGDFYWMQHVDFGDIKYIGLDIVEKLVNNNGSKFNSPYRSFMCKDIVNDELPQGDVIMIRDCWVHLSYEDTMKCVMNLKRSNIKYVLTTSFPNCKINEDLTKIWRPLNLQNEPFNFPKPLQVIVEGCTENEGKYTDKSLMLWAINDLPNFTV